jgi:hypothetical protein
MSPEHGSDISPSPVTNLLAEGLQRPPRRRQSRSRELQHDAESFVNRRHLSLTQVANEVTEALRIDGGGLFDEDQRALPVNFDLGAEPGWPSACGCRSDEPRGERQEV